MSANNSRDRPIPPRPERWELLGQRVETSMRLGRGSNETDGKQYPLLGNAQFSMGNLVRRRHIRTAKRKRHLHGQRSSGSRRSSDARRSGNSSLQFQKNNPPRCQRVEENRFDKKNEGMGQIKIGLAQ